MIMKDESHPKLIAFGSKRFPTVRGKDIVSAVSPLPDISECVNLEPSKFFGQMIL